VEAFFEELGSESIGHFDLSSIPPWHNSSVEVDTSLNGIYKKQEQPHLLAALAKEKIDSYSGFTCIYTDGSKRDVDSSSAAAAFYVKNLNISHMYKLSRSSVYKAELFAILQALLWIENSSESKVLIISDSLSSLISISNSFSSANPVLLKEIINSILRLSSTVIVKFLWIPSHVGIPGNEYVDLAAKNALDLPSEENVPLDLSEVYTLIESFVCGLWQSMWFMVKNTYIYKQIVPKVSFEVKFGCICRAKEVVLTRLRFDNTHANGHLFKIKCHPNGECDLCSDYEDPKHILMDCVYHQNEQANILDLMYSLNLPINYISMLKNQNMYDIIFSSLTSIKAHI